MRPTADSTIRRPIATVLAAVLAIALIGVATADARPARAAAAPTIVSFSASATTLASTAGPVIFLSSVTGDATSCTLTVAPAVAGVPLTTSCSLGLSWPVSIPPNVTAKASTYKFMLVVAYQAGTATKTVKSMPVTITVQAPPPATYVALGDSFSSGEGNPAKSGPAWLDTEGKPTQIDNGCDRSAAAYPVLVQKSLKKQKTLPTMTLRFLACSGENTEDLWNSHAAAAGLVEGKGTEPKQLGDTTDLKAARIVTVTTGGDDVNFADILESCILEKLEQSPVPCGPLSTDPWVRNVDANIATLEPILVKTYRRIEKAAPNAALYVVGYPDLFPPTPTPAQVLMCDALATGLLAPELAYLIHGENALTAAVQSAANAAGAHFVDPNTGPHSFIGRDICGKHPWFNGIKLLPNERKYSLHPNAAGQKALAHDLQEAIAGNATPTGPPPLQGTIAFIHSELGATDIWTERADGSGLAQLTHDGNDYHPALSPNGTEVAYEHNENGRSELWIVNSDGSDPHEVPNSPAGYGANWSPDGTSIIFTRPQSRAIYRIGADGSGLAVLAQAENPTFPHYSPDGNTIYYSTYGGYYSLWRMNANGTGQTQLTSYDQDAYSPAPSPDGTRLAYNSYSERNFEGLLTTNSDIYVSSIDGTGVTDMTNGFAGVRKEDFYPTWSPDNAHLAYATERCATDGSTCIEIGEVAEPEEENETQLTPQDWNANEPSWVR